MGKKLLGAYRGSVLVPLLFNILLYDLYFTYFFVGDDLNDVILKFQSTSKTLFKWLNLNNNQIKATQEVSFYL